MTVSDRLGRLRRLLYDPPATESWAAICDLLDTWPEEDPEGLTIALDYTAEGSRSWPDDTRTASAESLARITWPWETPPSMPLSFGLARHLALRPLKGNRILRGISNADFLGHITHISATGPSLNTSGIRVLARAKALIGLTHLALTDGSLSPEVLTILGRTAFAGQLTHLDLSGNNLKTRAFRPLENNESFERLTHLTLSRNRVSNATVDALLAWPNFANLALLDVSQNTLAYHGARRLSEAMPEHGQIILTSNALKDTNAASLAESLNDSRRTTRLDELLDSTPDVVNWQAICTLFDMWPTDDHEGMIRAIDANAARLDRWPDALRTPQPRWLRALAEDKLLDINAPPRPQWALVRTVHFNVMVRWNVAPFHWLQRLPEFVGTALHHLHITTLDLSSFHLTHDALAAIVNNPGAASLQNLILNNAHNPLGASLADLLTQTPHLTGLRHLDLTRHRLTAKDIQRLARSPNLASLTKLTLDHNTLGLTAIKALASAPFTSTLETLNLIGTNLKDRSAIILAINPSLTALTHLNLSGNHLSAASITSLLNHSTLRVLNLSYSALKDDGDLSTRPPVRPSRIRYLDLNHAQLKDEGLRAILDNTHLSHLQMLTLSQNSLTDESAAALASCTHLSNLHRLTLSNCRLTTKGARALAASRHLTALTHLDLGSNKITNAGVIALLSSPHLTALTHLSFHGNPLKKGLVDSLMKLKPSVPISHLIVSWPQRINAQATKQLPSSTHMAHVVLTHDQTWNWTPEI